MTLRGWSKLPCILITVLALSLTTRAQMTTSQYDNARTGANLLEIKLTPRNVNPQQFGKLFTLKVDGDIYAQPLFLADVQIPGKGRHEATPTISANGMKDGIVWVLITKGWNAPDRPEVLHAYDALDIAHELYNSNYYAARDQAGQSLRFNTPTVMNGHVYVGAKREVDVYGLLPTGAKK